MTDRKLAMALALSAAVLCGLIVVALLFWPIPARNETLLGTVVGFIFGNMVGPVYRAVFGQTDEGTREMANRAVDALAASTPRTDDPMPVQVTNDDASPVPVETHPAPRQPKT